MARDNPKKYTDISVNNLQPANLPQQSLGLLGSGIMAKADPHRTGVQCSGAFVGKRRAVQSRPHGNAPLGKAPGGFLAVHFRHKGNRSPLVRPGNDPQSQGLQPLGTALCLPLLPAGDFLDPHLL